MLWAILVPIGAFVLGLITHIIAAYLYDMREVFFRERLAIGGNWAEYIAESEGHQFSHGRIYYNKKKGIYCFDGTNFNNDGTQFCHWQTVASHVDREQRKFFYVFNAELEGELDKVYYGFGVVNLRVSAGSLIPADGHYVSANVDNQAMSHTMLATPYMSYERGHDGGLLIRLVTENLQGGRGTNRSAVKKALGGEKQ